jgi:hypothetical protein
MRCFAFLVESFHITIYMSSTHSIPMYLKFGSYVLFGLCNFRVRTKHIPCVQNLKGSVDVVIKRLWK